MIEHSLIAVVKRQHLMRCLLSLVSRLEVLMAFYDRIMLNTGNHVENYFKRMRNGSLFHDYWGWCTCMGRNNLSAHLSRIIVVEVTMWRPCSFRMLHFRPRKFSKQHKNSRALLYVQRDPRSEFFYFLTHATAWYLPYSLALKMIKVKVMKPPRILITTDHRMHAVKFQMPTFRDKSDTIRFRRFVFCTWRRVRSVSLSTTYHPKLVERRIREPQSRRSNKVIKLFFNWSIQQANPACGSNLTMSIGDPIKCWDE